MNKCKSYSDHFNCSLLLLLFLTRFCLNSACYFVAAEGSEDCTYSHLSKRIISPDLDFKFEGSFHVHFR